MQKRPICGVLSCAATLLGTSVASAQVPVRSPTAGAVTLQMNQNVKTGPAPTALAASATSPLAVHLTWNAVPGAVGYNIARNGFALTRSPIAASFPVKTPAMQRVTSAASGSRPVDIETKCCAYTDSVLAGSRYLYNVQAVFADTTIKGGWSTEAIVATSKLSPPQGLMVVAGESSMRLSWQPVPGASGYLVIRNQGALTPVVRGTSFVDAGLRPGTYTYRVASYEKTLSLGKDTVEAEGDLSALTEVKASTPIRGFADTHSHVLANLGFGGQFFWGQPFGDENLSLQACDDVHGFEALADMLGAFFALPVQHSLTHGFPDYAGWPRWNTLIHQQMYYTWIRRAYDGGLRLLVLHAVNNETVCRLSPNKAPGRSCDDMEAVNLQIQQAKTMETWIDMKSGGLGKGWFHIVHSPQEARDAIYGGKLAVVLGIEVDNLFGCRDGGSCTAQTVRDSLQKYYDAGVRHIHPIHFANNGFGGFAVFSDIFNINNRLLTGKWVDVDNCPTMGPVMFRFAALTKFEQGVLNRLHLPAYPTYPTSAGHCNQLGLTSLGETLLREMMSRHMIIDVDHMSAHSTDAAMRVTGNYPLIAGHTGFAETSIGAKASEGQKTLQQVIQLKQRGGMVSVILHQGSTQEIRSAGGKVANTCSGSSRSWAQAYEFAVRALGGRDQAAVGLASDQGLNEMVAPRFNDGRHSDGCEGNQAEAAQQRNPVVYPITPLVPGPQLQRSVSGIRTFDYNTEGMAHLGLLPDFVQDLQNIGLTAPDLAPLFRSAEAYISMWERIEATPVVASK